MEEINYQQLKLICDKRKSTRTYSGRPVSKDYIEKIKQIAYTSPYASGKKNWEIIDIQNAQSIQEIASLVKEQAYKTGEKIRTDFKEGFLDYAKNFTFFETAPLLFILIYRIPPSISLMLDQKDEFISEWERDNYVKSISCVAMLILLAVQSLGLGSCYMTGPLIASKQIIKFLDIKNDKKIGAIIPIGYPYQGGRKWK